MYKKYDCFLGISLLLLLMVGFGIIQEGEMDPLDFAMQMLLEKKRQQLRELSARLDNAMIETFIRNEIDPAERMEVDKDSGFGKSKLITLLTPNSKELCA